MALVLKDRVKETSTTTGTGTFTLAGAATGFQSFSVIGNSNTVYYAIVRNGYDEWEIGIGTYTSSGTTLSRDAVLESSNSGSKVNFSAGTKEVFCTYPAEKAVTIDDVQTLSNKTLASPSVTGSITFSDSSTQNTAATGFGFKNRIINGAMMIDQRNAGASVTPSATATFTYLTDRFAYNGNLASKFTLGQNLNSVTLPTGFQKYLGAQVASAVTIGSTDYFYLAHRIEGLNVADLGWGTAAASTVTLSFKVYSSLTGTFGGSLRNSDLSRSYPFSFTVSSANTWTDVSVTIAGDTSGTWLKTNGTGIEVAWSLGIGSTYSGAAGTWASANYASVTGAVSVVGTSGATFYITGVQLEKGSTATSFDYRPYGTELALCQRYAYVMNSNTRYMLGNGYFDSTTSVKGVNVMFPVTMRSSPTITYSGTTSNFIIQRPATSAASASAVSSKNIKTDSFEMTATSASVSTAGYATAVNLYSDAVITVSAEL